MAACEGVRLDLQEEGDLWRASRRKRPKIQAFPRAVSPGAGTICNRAFKKSRALSEIEGSRLWDLG